MIKRASTEEDPGIYLMVGVVFGVTGCSGPSFCEEPAPEQNQVLEQVLLIQRLSALNPSGPSFL